MKQVLSRDRLLAGWMVVYAVGFVLFKDKSIGSYWLQFWLCGLALGWIISGQRRA